MPASFSKIDKWLLKADKSEDEGEHCFDFAKYTWDDESKRLFVGQLRPAEGSNKKAKAKEAWLTYIVALNKGSTIDKYSFKLKASVSGTKQQEVDLQHLSAGIPRIAGPWEPVCKDLWVKRYGPHVKAMKQLRVMGLKTRKSTKKAAPKGAKSGGTEDEPSEQGEELKRAILNVKSGVSADQLKAFAVAVRKSAGIKKAPSVELVSEMRDWAGLTGQNLFEAPTYIAFLRAIGHFKRARDSEEPEASGAAGQGSQEPEPKRTRGGDGQADGSGIVTMEEARAARERVNLPMSTMVWYTTFLGNRRQRVPRALIEFNQERHDQMEALKRDFLQMMADRTNLGANNA
ncbi:hypothetical protein N0V95_004295 [Ascochyta clinopodiicola]|nr:hypothetical protein N0V95_004295 [Ascochyta clinopodiicola]